MTMTPPPASVSKNGIDVRDALSILSARAKDGGERRDVTNSTESDELKQMGQTIDISDQMEFANPQNAVGCDCARNNNDGDEAAESSPAVDEKEEERHGAMKRERERRGEEIRLQLKSMGVADLLGMIFRAQQERVATYKLFEEGLSTILASGNITSYPALCAKVTASFSVLSDTINAVKSSFLEKNQNKRKDITNAIAQLQKSESEKLNLTAALHLERLRYRNSQLEMKVSSSSEEGGRNGADDGRTAELLKNGIQMLEQKIRRVVEEINEVLDELRCIAADENEDY